MALIVTFDNIKAKCCKLCGCSSDDPSPFSDALASDIYGGKVPWQRYARHTTRLDCRVVAGRFCKLCVRVFTSPSYAHAYASIKDYLTHIRGKPEDHKSFSRDRKKLVNKVEASEVGSVDALSNVKLSIDDVREEKKTGHRNVKKRTFVEEAVHDKLYKGKPEHALTSSDSVDT